MDTKHTPGPWRISKHTDGRDALVYDADGFEVARTCYPNRTANSRLVAAAPALYEALEVAAQFVETEHFPIGWNLDRIREVLASVAQVTRPPTPVGWSDTDWIKHLQEQEPHPLEGLHINQGSMDAAADAYEAEYNADQEARRAEHDAEMRADAFGPKHG